MPEPILLRCELAHSRGNAPYLVSIDPKPRGRRRERDDLFSSRIEEILSVASAALPAVDDLTHLGNAGGDQLIGTYTFSDGSWPLFSSWVTWSDITLLADAGDDTLDGQPATTVSIPARAMTRSWAAPAPTRWRSSTPLPVTVDLASGYANENGDHDTISDVENVLGSE